MTDNISPDTPVYPIAVVRNLTGLTDRQIRYYEEMGLLRPARSPGGRRLFCASDVETLLKIKAEMKRGLRTAEIRARFGVRHDSREVVVPSAARRHLPHFAGGEPPAADQPDVETRRAYMARRGAGASGGPRLPRVDAGGTGSGGRQPVTQPIAPPPEVIERIRDRPAAPPRERSRKPK